MLRTEARNWDWGPHTAAALALPGLVVDTSLPGHPKVSVGQGDLGGRVSASVFYSVLFFQLVPGILLGKALLPFPTTRTFQLSILKRSHCASRPAALKREAVCSGRLPQRLSHGLYSPFP